MSDLDQFTPPATNLAAPPVRSPRGSGITQNMKDSLRQTRPWVLLIAIIGFLLSGIMILAGLATMLLGGIADEMIPGLGAIGGVVAGLVYIALSMIYIFPSYFLFKYA